MRSSIRVIVLVIAIWLQGTMNVAWGQSTETFNTIRLEDPSSIGSFVSLNPPSGISPYALTLPASLSTGSWSILFNGSTGNGSWGPWINALGSTTQLTRYKGTDSLRGSSGLTFDETATQLVFSNASLLTATDTAFRFVNTATATGASIAKVGIHVAATGSLSGSGSTNVGLIVDAQGASKNYAAIFRQGSVGIGTSAPNTMLDVAEDVAFRELNYTTALSATNNDLSFSTGNKSAFVRIATQSADFTITGLAGGYDGKIMTIYNASGRVMTVKHESTSSSASNRINNCTASSLIFSDKGTMTLIYSATDSRWIVVATMGLRGMYPEDTTKTITSTDKTLPSSNNNYIQVTNNSGEITPIFQDGSYIGQILVVQNNGPQNLKILNASNVKCDGGEASLGTRDIATFIWDGTKWCQIGFDSDN